MYNFKNKGSSPKYFIGYKPLLCLFRSGTDVDITVQ